VRAGSSGALAGFALAKKRNISTKNVTTLELLAELNLFQTLLFTAF